MKQNTQVRPGWDDYFLELADVVGKRGTCDRGRCGAVITHSNRIIMTGYAGSPAGQPHCDEVGHDMQERKHSDGTLSNHCVRTSHAEENAIVHAARFGTSLDGATLYTKMMPCINCARLIITAGIIRVVAAHGYHASTKSSELFDSAGVEYAIISTKEIYTA
jgi:dCMP deaminase